MRTFTAAAFALGIAVALVALTTEPTLIAHPAPCDFLTGGGFIMTTGGNTHAVAKGTFVLPPAQATGMYEPAIQGRSTAGAIVVE